MEWSIFLGSLWQEFRVHHWNFHRLCRKQLREAARVHETQHSWRQLQFGHERCRQQQKREQSGEILGMSSVSEILCSVWIGARRKNSRFCNVFSLWRKIEQTKSGYTDNCMRNTAVDLEEKKRGSHTDRRWRELNDCRRRRNAQEYQWQITQHQTSTWVNGTKNTVSWMQNQKFLNRSTRQTKLNSNEA